MAVVAIKIKVMPESLETDLESLKEKVSFALLKEGAIKINSIDTEEIAFGLKALIITFAWPEDKDTTIAENAVKISGVSSGEILDYRRAFG